MKKTFLFGTALMACVWSSCSQDENLTLSGEENSVFTGGIELVESRTSLEDHNVVSWVVGDKLSIFTKNNYNRQYEVSGVNNGTATFKYLSFDKPTTVVDIDGDYAVYPYNQSNTIDASGALYAPVKADYGFKDRESFISSALMAAKDANNKNFNFKNVQGYLRMRLYAEIPEDYAAVKSVTFTSKSKDLTGTAKIEWAGNIPSATIVADAGKSLTVNLDKSKDFKLSEEGGEPVEFYVPVLPMEFGANDVTMKVTFKNGETYTKDFGNPFSIVRREVTGLKHTIGGNAFEGVIEDDVLDKTIIVTNETEFIAALQKGGEIVLENDLDLTGESSTEITKDATIDLNGFNISANRPSLSSGQTASVLYVSDCKLTLTGKGRVENTAPEGAYAIAIYNAAEVTIDGNVTCGAYHDAFYVKFGKLFIKDGFFYSSEDTNPNPDVDLSKYTNCTGLCHKASVINCDDDSYTWSYGHYAIVSLTGGVYVNFNPSIVHEGRLNDQNFVADGYKVIAEPQDNGDVWYKVVSENY